MEKSCFNCLRANRSQNDPLCSEYAETDKPKTCYDCANNPRTSGVPAVCLDTECYNNNKFRYTPKTK